MANILPYAQRHRSDEVRYGGFPAWLVPFNGLAIALAFVGFVLNLTSGLDVLVAMFCSVLLIPHWLLLVLPSIWQVIFAERVSPKDRLVAIVMIVAGFVGMVSVSWMGWGRLHWWC